MGKVSNPSITDSQRYNNLKYIFGCSQLLYF